MRNATILGLAAGLLLFSLHTRAQSPRGSLSPFYSADEYQRAHSLFNKLQADLNAAQASTPANLLDQARTGVRALQNNWDNAVYDSRQIYDTIVALETAADGSALERDRANLGDDVSRLLDLRREYY
jgi:hypothetical protein